MDAATAQGSSSTPQLETLRQALGATYAVERELGRGGMATVWLARDLRHDRRVAVKVLHAELAAVLGAARFLAEIRTTAALQHPHILPLFDSGEVAGQLFYVMPFVEGETLRARLAREQQLPVADALRIASEVASALDYAHRHGVVHRDVKPENILLGEDGQALVADFGIAPAVSHASGERMTQTGLSLGTPQYMAPEQAAAERVVDARADIYALGAVTYEMLAGEPPFGGPSAQAVIARLMTEEPRPLGALRRSVPPHVHSAIHTALEKLPADRFESAGAFASALDDPTRVHAGAVPHRAAPASRRASPLTMAVLGAALLAAGGALGVVVARATMEAPTPARGSVRFIVGPDSGVLGSGGWWYSTPAISPDGRTVVYAASGPGGARLHARRIDDVVARAIPGTEGGDGPFFSPDGLWLGYGADGGRTIRKVRLDGGTPVLVAELPASDGTYLRGAWGPGDTIHYSTFSGGSALHRVSAAGGTPVKVAVTDTTHHLTNPAPLPGGRALLVTATRDWRVGRVAVLELASGRVRRFASGTGARYVDGQLVYAGPSGALYRQPFDLDRLAPSGPAEEIAGGLDVHYAAFSPVDVGASGAHVYRIGRGSWKLALMDREGREQRVLSEQFPWSPRFSPDGRKLAYSALTPGQHGEDMWSGEVWHTDILVTDLATGTVQRLTTDGNDNNEPVWSPDGREVAFDAGLLGSKDLYVRAIDGDSARRLGGGPGDQFPMDWTPDGSAVLHSDRRAGIWLQPTRGGPARPYIGGTGSPSDARVSPDGRWVAYSSSETGRREVYVQSFPTPGRKMLVSEHGGRSPRWRRDGRELFYWDGDQLRAASLEPRGGGEPPVVRSRTPLFRTTVVGGVWDVSPDGMRFAVVRGGPRESRVVVALGALPTR